MKIGERIAAEMLRLGISEGELGRRSGVNQPTIHRIITGDSKSPRQANVEKIAKALGVTPEWLWRGEGAQPLSDLVGIDNVSPAAQPDRLYRYPVVSEVQAGAWTEAVQPYEPGAEDRFELTDYQARGPAFWLEVTGDSMTSPVPPSIPEGHFILVDTGLIPQPGDLVVAKLDTEDRATFKKLVSDAGQLYLKPLNPAYRMIPIDGNCRLIGVVKEAKQRF
ncbi:LexA family protein [Azotobacter salinestris]|uniref:LexA family protein n=1 Tax=Azotobacter salinestris TaxID=69964 RepID=UPI001266A9B6|nr:S24 family peptidase [Azotobacter salinestris]